MERLLERLGRPHQRLAPVVHVSGTNGKGSTVGSYVIYGLKVNGTAPAAIINRETDTITATGVILAEIPCVDRIDIGRLKAGQKVRVLGSEGVVEVDED